MGHPPGFPCIYSPDNHEGICSTRVIGLFVDLDKTRWFKVTETHCTTYWRTNITAPEGSQVELLHEDGEWCNAPVFGTEQRLLRTLEAGPWPWREIAAEEVPHAGPDPEAA